jgi:hypothetical protein
VTSEAPKDDGAWPGPVRWMLGRKLLSSLGQIWTNYRVQSTHSGMGWMRADRYPEGCSEGKEVWFDYISDSGDSVASTYRAALACYTTLHVRADGTLTVDAEDGRPANPRDVTELPRGRFLVFGGDTAYHVADEATLKERLLKPFRRAYATARADADSPTRLYGIPGNHDHYDALVGFNLLFRGRTGGGGLTIPGMYSIQDASYFAIDLPFGWTLLALDAQLGGVDVHQQAFFKDVLGRRDAPMLPPELRGGRHPGQDKLILLTPEPSTVFGELPLHRDVVKKKLLGSVTSNIHATLTSLGLELPLGTLDAEGHKVAPAPPAPERRRLDLSGDTHHYARYTGRPMPSTSPTGDGEAPATVPVDRDGRPHHVSYASVVSGLGGAFLHPTHTRGNEVPPDVEYPTHRASRTAVYPRLFSPGVMLLSGNLGLLGGLVCAILWCAGRLPDRPWWTAELGEPIPPAARDIGSSWQWHPWLIVAILVAGGAFFGLLRWKLLLKQDRPPLGPRSGCGIALLIGFVTSAPWLLGAHEDASAVALYAQVSLAVMVQLLGFHVAGWVGARIRPWSRFGFLEGVPAMFGIVSALAGLGVSFRLLRTMGALQVAVYGALFLVALLVLGVVVLAAVVGGGRHTHWWSKVLMGGPGVVMSFALLSIAWVWSTATSWPVIVAGLALVVAVALGVRVIGYPKWQIWNSNGVLLTIFTIAFGLMTAAPWGGKCIVEWLGWQEAPLNPFLVLLVSSFAAALVCCTVAGGYFAVMLSLRGHNNEAGGAAGVDRFTQILRIRVMKEGLEVFCIAAMPDDAAESWWHRLSGAAGTPKVKFALVDRFVVGESTPSRTGGLVSSTSSSAAAVAGVP